MYATGDRARWREGGVLELLGRRDGQIKVRGFRVELAEVEAAIGSWPGVREATVVALEDGADGQRLIACIVAEQGCSLDVDSIRRFLRARLPSPMIPSRFRIVESLPRTLSGKVDRRNLSELLPDDVARDKAVIRPRDQIEEQLAAIWEDLLQIRPIGVTDGFFDLGGHSLLAVRLAARVEERFGQSLPLADLLLGSTIEELAARIREPIGSRATSSLIDLRVTGPGLPLYLVHPIGGGVLCRETVAWPAASMGHAPSSVFRPRALKVRRSPRRTSCAWHHGTSTLFARSIRWGPTSWAAGRWEALWLSRWPSSS